MSDFDPKGFKLVGDYLSSLKEESDTPPRDALNRTVVGRYYYSAFLQLRDILKKGLEKYPKSLRDEDFNDFILALEGNSPHLAIIAFLEALKEEIKDDVRIRQAHNSIIYMRELRNAADYDLQEKPEIKTPGGLEKVDFSSQSYVRKAQRKYSFVENLLDDDGGDKLKDIIRVRKNTVIDCIKRVLRTLR